ncbi:MAG: hypothetical protein GY838_00600, partial [bacterium]|nr:hypothetical protein [bacterium]
MSGPLLWANLPAPGAPDVIDACAGSVAWATATGAIHLAADGAVRQLRAAGPAVLDITLEPGGGR